MTGRGGKTMERNKYEVRRESTLDKDVIGNTKLDRYIKSIIRKLQERPWIQDVM